jgi:hypothetical protein
MTRQILIISLLPLLLVQNLSYAEGNWRYSAGASYMEGDYGESQDTEMWFFPVSARYTEGDWSGKISSSWIDLDGPADVVATGDGGTVNRGNSTGTRSESGLGDTWVSATYSAPPVSQENIYLDFTGKIKIPTADEDDGLGTGETDYTLQVEGYKSIDAWTPMGTVAYKIKGDPDDSSLDNVWYLSGGADYKLNNEQNIGLTLDYQEASSSGSDDILEIFGYLGQKIDAHNRLSIYGILGLDDGSPDFGIGIQWSYTPPQ